MASLRAARPAEAFLTTFELPSLPLPPWRWLRARFDQIGEEAPRRGRSLRRHRRGGALCCLAEAAARGSETCQETQKSTCLLLPLLPLLPLPLLREEESAGAAARRSKSAGLDARPLTVAAAAAAAAAAPPPEELPPLC